MSLDSFYFPYVLRLASTPAFMFFEGMAHMESPTPLLSCSLVRFKPAPHLSSVLCHAVQSYADASNKCTTIPSLGMHDPLIHVVAFGSYSKMAGRRRPVRPLYLTGQTDLVKVLKMQNGLHHCVDLVEMIKNSYMDSYSNDN